MARNEEKQLARLNRFYLQQQKDEQLKKKPPRPKLNDLYSADEVKKWLPSIKEDINYYLAQSSVPCYPQKQIEEFNRRIDKLQGEYRAFLRKLRFLDPDIKSTPWTNRPYSSKRSKINSANQINDSDTVLSESSNEKKSKLSVDLLIPTPVLDNDNSYKTEYGYQEQKTIIPSVNFDLQDEPLQFDQINMPAITWATKISRQSANHDEKNIRSTVGTCSSNMEIPENRHQSVNITNHKEKNSFLCDQMTEDNLIKDNTDKVKISSSLDFLSVYIDSDSEDDNM
ncbi:uncharacterized protein LOC126818666 isoform X2 [Patella vulgata]|uniref:uncharacterized protein LOC126818666 isoform X2 n=1 Tax=Patella vulgata TaxID=6465 RepID=UPI00217F812E|nr:uncharacterized protein LOC126818666 isoform X2 [Patella vulgata]